jgi:D-psicose/D-tagatose/L-ribulose 3-epimerase
MKLGVSAFAWTANFDISCLRLLTTLREQGISSFEIPMFDPSALPVREIRSAFIDEGLNCTVCAILPKGLNPISEDSSDRRQAGEHLARCVQVSGEIGATLVGGPLFAPTGYIPAQRPTQQQWFWAVEAFQKLIETLREYDIALAIEPVNRSETSFLRTAAEAKRLCEAIGDTRIGVTLDTFHANIEESSIPGAVQLLGKHLKHVHMSENDRGPLGRGHIPFGQIVSALRAIDYRGYLMIEGFGYAQHQTSAPGWLWAPMDITPEILVEESARYLREVLAEY